MFGPNPKAGKVVVRRAFEANYHHSWAQDEETDAAQFMAVLPQGEVYVKVAADGEIDFVITTPERTDTFKSNLNGRPITQTTQHHPKEPTDG